MEGLAKTIRNTWKNSRVFRILLILAFGYAILRLAVHGAYLAMMLYPDSGIMGGMPGWTGAEGEPTVPVDLQIYLDAAERFQQRQPLYTRSSRIEIYQYPPLFALAFMPFLHLPAGATVLIHSGLHIAAYALLYVTWDRIFGFLSLVGARRQLARTLPLWLVFYPFWSDLGYLNIYVIMALLATLLISAVLQERLVGAVLWLALILQIKPHWAFAAALPLLLGRHQFFIRLVAYSFLATAALVGGGMLATGPAYVWDQYRALVRFLPHLVGDFPWRPPSSPFLGYNHSIKQIIFYLLGVKLSTARLVTGIKIALLAPLGLVAGRVWLGSEGASPRHVPHRALDLTFALYLGVFIWLDMVWEASLAGAASVYLIGTLRGALGRIVAWGVFVPYALLDVWQLLSVAVCGMDIVAPGLYVLTDPSIYVPLTMVLILGLYTLLLMRLWRSGPSLPLNPWRTSP